MALETEVAIDNADAGRLAYATNPKVRGAMKSTPQGSHEDRFIWDSASADRPVNGYRCAVSTNVPSNLSKGAGGNVLSALVFGNWAEAIIGSWGVIEIDSDPYGANFPRGDVAVRVLFDMDTNIRHLQSFAASKEISTS